MSPDNIDFSGKNISDADQLFDFANRMGFGELHIKLDKETGLQAIVAIHNTNLGPALGGCRCIEYPSTAAAMLDAMRLARGMSYKAAVTGVPHGGGKAVLIKPPVIEDRIAYFEAFGRFVNDLGGRYITAKDSGTGTADMDIIATQTAYVTSTSNHTEYKGDPSPCTALGVFHGIAAAVAFQLKRNSLEGVHVAIQGVGAVGYYLAKLLHEHGARSTVCDIDPKHSQRCQEEFGSEIVTTDAIYDVTADVFAPCALGMTVNQDTIPRLQAKIIAGAANNQLEQRNDGKVLMQRGILYAPDYVINAGGLIYAAAKYDHASEELANLKINEIGHSLTSIFERAEEEQLPTNIIASKIARERLGI